MAGALWLMSDNIVDLSRYGGDPGAGGAGHPFLRFLEIDEAPLAPEMVLDGVMQAGQVVLTGPRGCGKSTIAVTIAMLASHLCRRGHLLRPKLRRRVIYVAEDPMQAMMTTKAMTLRHGGAAGYTLADVRDRIKFVRAARLDAETIADAADGVLDLSIDNVSASTGYRFSARPLVILDTRNATIEVREENDNAEASEILAVLRARFDVPILLIAHPAKSNAGSTRGAGAWESDALQVIYVSVDEASRVRTVHLEADFERDAKRRFESVINHLHVISEVVTFEALDQLGETVDLRVRCCDLEPELPVAAAERQARAPNQSGRGENYARFLEFAQHGIKEHELRHIFEQSIDGSIEKRRKAYYRAREQAITECVLEITPDKYVLRLDGGPK